MLGKTNLDQFATGLVGARSPYGTPRNPFDARFIPGGSSSGSAVAAGLVSFGLGIDTAGSGRVPAAFNNIVGLKPTAAPEYSRPRPRLPVARLRLDLCADRRGRGCVFDVAAWFDPDDPLARLPDTAGSGFAVRPAPAAELRTLTPFVALGTLSRSAGEGRVGEGFAPGF